MEKEFWSCGICGCCGMVEYEPQVDVWPRLLRAAKDHMRVSPYCLGTDRIEDLFTLTSEDTQKLEPAAKVKLASQIQKMINQFNAA